MCPGASFDVPGRRRSAEIATLFISFDSSQELETLHSRQKDLEKKRKGIMRAIGVGAPCATFRTRFEEIESDLATVASEITEAETDANELATPPPDLHDACAKALEEVDKLLGDPEFAHEAHELLAKLTEKIPLSPDETTPDVIAAEIMIDFGRILFLTPLRRDKAPPQAETAPSVPSRVN